MYVYMLYIVDEKLKWHPVQYNYVEALALQVLRHFYYYYYYLLNQSAQLYQSGTLYYVPAVLCIFGTNFICHVFGHQLILTSADENSEKTEGETFG